MDGSTLGAAIALMKKNGGGSGTDITDVQVNGTSVVGISTGVANIPVADASTLGAVRPYEDGGVGILTGSDNAGRLVISQATSAQIKSGDNQYKPISVYRQHESSFYGLAKAAGDSTQSASNNNVGEYTETAKSKISDMLNAPVSVSGSTPSITAMAGVRYICGECSTLSITAPASGCIDVVFKSGSTATDLTVSSAKSGVSAVKFPAWFDPDDLDANTTYEINILDGEFGVVTSWA